jgi:hypothetical protein
MVEHFADGVLHNHPPRWSAADAALNLRTIEALLSSARAGGVCVPLP